MADQNAHARIILALPLRIKPACHGFGRSGAKFCLAFENCCAATLESQGLAATPAFGQRTGAVRITHNVKLAEFMTQP
jgi:hypothetical protein